MGTKFPLVRVNQWLRSWDDADYTQPNLPKPDNHFFIGSIPIKELRRLSGVSRRQVEDRRKIGDAGYQRAHEAERSTKISRYIRWGFPVSSSPGIRASEHPKLVHPGWLPTAILVNVLKPNETRRRNGRECSVAPGSVIKVHSDGDSHHLEVPETVERSDTHLEPLEIIDGQHRIFAVDELEDLEGEYEVPVVLFHGLTTSWQAYLFWVINVEPKKINPSLAFDLYPELRNQSWLEQGENLKVYREHRAQELTEALWRHETSVWRKRVELLGNRVPGHVSNAAFIRTLMATFVRRWGPEHRIGGLFGSVRGDGEDRVLRWTRAQQAAFLLTMWKVVSEETKRSRSTWAEACREASSNRQTTLSLVPNSSGLDAAFAGPHTLLATDQGVRAISYVFNAIFQIRYSELELENWEIESVEETMTDRAIDEALASLQRQRRVTDFLRLIARELVSGDIDWRTSKAPKLSESERLRQGAYRGSGGYTALQQTCMSQLTRSSDANISDAATQVTNMAVKQ